MAPYSRFTFSALLLPTLLAPVLLLGSCGSSTSAGAGPFAFVDIAAEAGVDVVNVSGDPRRWYIPESNGTGAAWLDHDLDGDMDLFVGNGAAMKYIDDGAELEVVHTASARLYRNDGDLNFTDVTTETGAGVQGWINGLATGDVEGDGDTDLYLAAFGPDVFLRNEGGRFEDGTEAAGLGNQLWGAAATFGDPDLDGDLDLFVANYVLFDPSYPPMGGARMVYEGVEVGWGPEGEAGEGINSGAPNRYFENDGAGHFEESSREVGLSLEKALCSYAAVFCDMDGDSWPDLLVANDVQPTSFFRNRGDGTFVEEGEARGFATNAEGKATAAMGLAVEDIDQDGDFDVLRTNFDFEANCLHINDGEAQFRDMAAAHGLAAPSMDRLGWGCGFFDADLDGDLDLMIANGHVLPQATEVGMNGWAQQSQLFAGSMENGRPVWRDVTSRSGSGLKPLRSARGLALGDPDDDGDIDAVIIDIDQAPRLLENRGKRLGHWLRVQVVGTRSNPDGYGAVVEVLAGDQRWRREARTTDGLYSARDPRLHFGLGKVEAIDEVLVYWPSGTLQRVKDVELDSFLTITEPE